MTIADDIKRAFDEIDTDHDLNDVELVGSDGGRVSANKVVLSLRSPVFRKMFFGEFKERTEREVSLDYHSNVISALVKYCYTDSMNYECLDVGPISGTEFVAMVQLRNLANYLDIVDLYTIVSDKFVGELLKDAKDKYYLGFMCQVLQEVMVREGTEGPLGSTCMELIKEFPESCLFTKTDDEGIKCCSFDLLETIFLSIGKKMRPDVAVKALQLWNENNGSSFKEDLAQPAKLMELADEVDLESMEAARFEKIDPCPLFQANRLYKALQGSVAMGRYILKPSKTPTKRVAVVCGAGLDCANGRYTWRKDRKQYEMMREYEGAAGVFSLKMDANDNLWKLCVTIRKNSNASTSTVLYSSTSTNTREPPFSSWKSFEGSDPTPCVSAYG